MKYIKGDFLLSYSFKSTHFFMMLKASQQRWWLRCPWCQGQRVDNLYVVDLKKQRRQIENRCVYTLKLVTIREDFTS